MQKIIISIFILSALFLLTGCEREGMVNIDDCRETIKIKSDNIKTYYKTFTCTYEKTDKGDIMSGACINLKTGLFSDKCKIAYIYERGPSKKCPENGYLNQDGNCYCDEGFILKNDFCVKPDYFYLLNEMSDDLIFNFIWEGINEKELDEKIDNIRNAGYSDWVIIDYFSYSNAGFSKLLSQIRDIKYDDTYLLNELSYHICKKRPTVPSVPNDKSLNFFGNSEDYKKIKNYLINESNYNESLGKAIYNLSYPGHIIKYSTNKYDKNVEEIQSRLNIEYGENLVVDGYFGNETLNAIKDFQKQKGIDSNGIVDEKTWNKLFN